MLDSMEQIKIHEIITHNLPVGFSIVDKEGIVIEFNRAAEKITGYEKNDVIGKSHLEIFHGSTDKKACPLFKHALLERKQIVATEANIRKKNGDLIILSVTAFALLNNDGDFLGGVELFRDITEYKKLERERKNILSMFAHDMKNPIVTSGGFLSRLLAGKAGALTNKQQDYLEFIRDDLQKVENLISSFLEFSRLETKEYKPMPGPFDLEMAINKVIALSRIEADKKNIEIIFDSPQENPVIINADSMMINRVITNLLNNALKYTHPEGTITVKLSESDKDTLVHVTDTGVGISEDHLPYIFDAFFRVSRDSIGSGLGLAITKTIIEAHGGRLWVESTSGVGSTFSFTLPKNSA